MYSIEIPTFGVGYEVRQAVLTQFRKVSKQLSETTNPSLVIIYTEQLEELETGYQLISEAIDMTSSHSTCAEFWAEVDKGIAELNGN